MAVLPPPPFVLVHLTMYSYNYRYAHKVLHKITKKERSDLNWSGPNGQSPKSRIVTNFDLTGQPPSKKKQTN